VAELTPETLAELRRLHETATPGPWYHDENEDFVYTRDEFGDADGEIRCDTDCDEADAAFIAATRNALPDLLDEIERLRAENGRLRLAVAKATISAAKALDEVEALGGGGGA
jgi:hypothetical protein